MEVKQDKRVIGWGETNIRYVEKEDIAELIEFSSIDVAFISLEIVFSSKKFVKRRR